eukprot:4279091-Prymnesium_polylepis.1
MRVYAAGVDKYATREPETLGDGAPVPARLAFSWKKPELRRSSGSRRRQTTRVWANSGPYSDAMNLGRPKKREYDGVLSMRTSVGE